MRLLNVLATLCATLRNMVNVKLDGKERKRMFILRVLA
jgi:hypothetical protein